MSNQYQHDDDNALVIDINHLTKDYVTAAGKISVLKDVNLHVRRGEMVVIYLAAANRDPAVFPDPHTFDVGRVNAGRHLAFSGGRHFCLGAALARMEGEIGLHSFFTRFPDAQLAGEGSRRDTRVLRGWARLPVRLGASAPIPG